MTSEPGPSNAHTADASPRSQAPDSQSSDSQSSGSQAPDPVISALNRLNNSKNKAQADEALRLGQATFERGRYRKAIEAFQQALALSNPMGAKGGEIQMWLVNAYIAAGDDEAGLALCRKLILHPDLDTKQQSKRLLYILEAPELEMKPEWITQIPDLSGLEDDKGRSYAQQPKKARRRQPKPEPEPIDLSQVNTTDNQFIWIALIGIALTLGGLAWFS
jgi:tetratricopeptide (TPR) repeat protein